MSAISIIGLVIGITRVISATTSARAKGSLAQRLPQTAQARVAPLLQTVEREVVATARLEPIAALREQFHAHREEARRALETQALPRLEVERLATVVALEKTPFASSGPLVVGAVEVLSVATTTEEVRRAELALVQVVEGEHAAQFTNALGAACRRASVSLGFEPREIRATSDRIRVVATDARGRSLVSEITMDADKEARVETEVVGVRDGSCKELLDAFDAALAREGVEGERRERRETGGVCTLSAAREFFGKALRKVAPAARDAAAVNVEAPRRAARLNPRARAGVRRSS